MKKEIQDKEPNQNNKDQNCDFINKDISKFLSCPRCDQLMKNPMRLHTCGHTLCDKCAPNKGKCPTCNLKILTTQRDLVGQGLVNQLLVRCLNQGCVYKGSFQDFKKFHKGKCKLQNGLDQWMQSMKNTLSQMASKTRKYSKENQSENQMLNKQSTSKQQSKIQPDQKEKKIELNWDDQPFSQRQLKKQL